MRSCIAYGGQDIVTPDGKLHLDDPKVKAGGDQGAELSRRRLQGRLRAAERDQLERRRRQQRLPREADGDGFRRHDFDRGRDQGEAPEWYYNDIVTHGLPLSDDNDGKPVPSISRDAQRGDPEGGEERRGGQGVPQVPDPAEGPAASTVKPGSAAGCRRCRSSSRRPFWQNPKDPHLQGYVQQGLLGPTLPDYYVYNPAMAEVRCEHVWSMAMIDVVKERHDAGGGDRQGVQADRGDLREISRSSRA